LIAHGIGPKEIQVYTDASSKELVKKLYKEFPALNGVHVSYAKALRSQISDDEIMDNSVSLTTLKARKKLVVKFSSSKYFSVFRVQWGRRKIFSFCLTEISCFQINPLEWLR
jgi:hypothetical protein